MAWSAAAVVAAAALLSAASISLLAGRATAQGKTGQITVFWGRHKDEGSLREACDSGLYSMVIMSFLDVYGGGGGRYNLNLSGHSTAGMGAAIKRCQYLGVPVSISIGGFGGAYSLPTNASAAALFDHLWNTYFGGSLNDTTGRRPFGDAWLDGVDMFLEHAAPGEHYATLALELARHNIRAGDGKLLHLTDTPRCGFPDARVKAALDTGIFERVHVRFYGDGDGEEGCGGAGAGGFSGQRRRVGQVDGGVPVHQVLRRPAGVAAGGQERVHGPRGAPDGGAPRGAEGGQLRRRHGVG